MSADRDRHAGSEHRGRAWTARRLQERMNSPLESREVRLRGLPARGAVAGYSLFPVPYSLFRRPLP
jgi:hypothetical protein